MTDRLSVLLHDEAGALDVPPAPAAEVIAAGRGLRRRRTTGVVAGTVAAVLAVVGIAVVDQRWSDDDTITPAEQQAYVEKGAWAVGDELHIGDRVVRLPGLQAVRYTSLGALVWVGAGGTRTAELVPELVTPDGEVHAVDAPGSADVIFHPPATDPGSSLIAYPRAADRPRHVEVVVTDLATGQTRVVGKPLFTTSEPASVPVALSGDDVIVRPGGAVRLDISSGERLPVFEGMVTLSGYAAGHVVASDMHRREWQVVSADDGQVLLTVRNPVPASHEEMPSLSPDGRYFAAPSRGGGVDVYTVATGDSVRLGGDRDVADFGWTPDGHLIGKPWVSASEVESCDPVTGTCRGLGPVVAGDLLLVRGADGLPV